MVGVIGKMDRLEFMNQLESLLRDIPVTEREEALQYYNDYFDEAGPENEARVIRELGSPQKVASTIKDELSMLTEEETVENELSTEVEESVEEEAPEEE